LRTHRGNHIRTRAFVGNNDHTSMRPCQPHLSKQFDVFPAGAGLVGDNKVEIGLLHQHERFVVILRAL
jgi:hypothetical protein